MSTLRVIPRLDIKAPNLIKGVQFEGLRVLGPPEDFAAWYAEEGADELFYMDIVASLYQRNSILDLVSRTSSRIFIPLTVGGGLRSLSDIEAALKAGADKVAVNTAAVRRPALIAEAANRFGASTIVVSIEAKRVAEGAYEAYVDNGREKTGLDVLSWAKQAADLGAGELILTSVDREGTGKGYDLDLVRQVARAVPIPVIASGGAGTVAHVTQVVAQGKADAVAVGSMLHYHARPLLDHLPGRPPRTPGFLEPVGLETIKAALRQSGVPCRSVGEVRG